VASTANVSSPWALDELGSDWHVFHGLKLWQDQDFDHVLLGPRGVFYIQIKHLQGME
jgi:hypothetical protein